MKDSRLPKAERHWYPFSLRTLLIGLLVFSGYGPSNKQQAIDTWNRGVDYVDNGEPDKANRSLGRKQSAINNYTPGK